MKDRSSGGERSLHGTAGTLLVPLAGTVASGVLYALAFPGPSLWPVAWIALVPFFVALRQAQRWAVPLLGWLWPVVCCSILISWLPRAMARYYDQPISVGLGAFLAVSTLTAGLEFMLFAVVYRRLAGRLGWAEPLVTAAAWVAAELGRGKLFTGNPWALVGYSQVPFLAMLQVADLTGVYGVSFVVVAGNAAAARLWLARRTRGDEWRSALGGSIVAAVVVAATLAYGWTRLAGADRGSREPGPRVAVVQGNVEILTFWDPSRYGEHFEKYLRLTLAELRRSRPAVVFWPENAMNFFVERESGYRQSVAGVLAASGAELVAGGPHTDDGGPPFYNSAFLIDRDGRVRARQDKRFLIPFAEYFPFAGSTLLRRQFDAVREFSHGAIRPPLPTAAGDAGVLVCHESLYPEAAAAQVALGATYLVNLSNDSWHGGEKYALAAFDVVVLRAIEQRRWVVRASTAGPSGIVDAWGRVVRATPPFVEAAASAELVSRSDRTVYSRWGDWFAFGSVGVVVAALFLRRHEPAR